MNKVLFVGNGFDLAHGLLTSYDDFLKVMKNRDVFNMAVDYYLQNKKPLDSSMFYTYFKDIKSLNEDNIKKLQEILATNSWVKYYSECEAEIDGWIDFEREIYPVIKLFEYIFNSDDKIEGNAIRVKDEFGFERERTALLWEYYISTDGAWIYIEDKFLSEQYGILKKKILQSLRDEFDEFIKAFEIYLLEFVHGVEHTEVLEQIKSINADYVISLNYTPTENWYGIDKGNVHHLHGVIREDVRENDDGINANGEKDNMVVGVNEQEDQNMDFIYFVKYFQRIQKASGTRYKDFVNSYYTDQWGEDIEEEYELHVYGHSLDETDEDILKYLIGDKDRNGYLSLKPEKVIIYYYNQSDYEQKVINLIKLYGRSIVEKYMEEGDFFFVPTDAKKCAI